MDNEIILLNNNDKRGFSDQEWISEFYEFLQGNLPERINIGRGHKPRLSQKQAFSVIWYLQEHFPIIPDRYEKCWSCGEIYNSYSEGIYWETKFRHYCGACCHQVPENYDRGKR